jgi:hypothetical protein
LLSLVNSKYLANFSFKGFSYYLNIFSYILGVGFLHIWSIVVVKTTCWNSCWRWSIIVITFMSFNLYASYRSKWTCVRNLSPHLCILRWCKIETILLKHWAKPMKHHQRINSFVQIHFKFSTSFDYRQKIQFHHATSIHHKFINFMGSFQIHVKFVISWVHIV